VLHTVLAVPLLGHLLFGAIKQPTQSNSRHGVAGVLVTIYSNLFYFILCGIILELLVVYFS